jgi:ADP-ribose pyrophosphatase YjhB (NUDIX family)
MQDNKPKKGKDYTGVAVVFACHDGNGKFLFAKRGEKVRDGQGAWEMPAGGVKFGEKIKDALVRELSEELCTVPLNIEELGYKDVIERNGDTIIKHWVTFEFLVQVDPNTVTIGEPESCTDIEWRALNNPPSPLHFGTDSTIENVKKHLRSKR